MIAIEKRKASILIVDSKKETNLTLTKILRKEGYWVGSTSNITKAMKILEKKDIDIVLIDIEMPDIDGMTFLKEIKKIKSSVQVVMMTDNGSVDSYLEAMELGAFEYFNKPIKNKILFRAIEKALASCQRTNF